MELSKFNKFNIFWVFQILKKCIKIKQIFWSLITIHNENKPYSVTPNIYNILNLSIIYYGTTLFVILLSHDY